MSKLATLTLRAAGNYTYDWSIKIGDNYIRTTKSDLRHGTFYNSLNDGDGDQISVPEYALNTYDRSLHGLKRKHNLLEI